MILPLCALFVSTLALLYAWRASRPRPKRKRAGLVPLLTPDGRLVYVPPMRPTKPCDEWTELDSLLALDLLDDDPDLDFGF